jgi:hypothetical protein
VQSESDKPVDRLRRIRPAIQPTRFLMSWDSGAQELWYGLGGGGDSVRISSSGKLGNWEGTEELGAKLERETVQHFLDNLGHTNGTELLHDCRKCLQAYVHFQDERIYLFLPIWTLATYVYLIFSHFGYLFFHSLLPRSGKTRIEEVLSHLAFEACDPLNAPTVPTIRDTACEGRTLVLDTLERWKGKSPEAYCAAMELLDAGFRNGGMVAKMEPVAKNKWRKRTIPVFAPYVLAGINRASLSDTALDRSFAIEMHRKKSRVKKRKYDHYQAETESRLLRQRMYLWGLDNAPAVARVYRSVELEAEVDALQLNDRAADIWKPIFAVLRTMGEEGYIHQLKALAREMASDPEADEDRRKLTIINTLKQLANGTGALVAMTGQLEEWLKGKDVKMKSAHELHGLLTTWGFTQESARIAGPFPRRSWRIEISRLQEIEAELTTE